MEPKNNLKDIEKLYYLGPKGSYSELACNKIKNYFNIQCELIETTSISQIVRYLETSTSQKSGAVLPIENSIEGVVRETQDKLAELVNKGYGIYSETTLDIEHSLITFAKSKDEIKTISSHPQALAQCKEYLYKNWGENINLNSVLSTSNAVHNLTNLDNTNGAIGSKYCAELYKIPVLETSINDEINNKTRFVLLSLETPYKNNINKVSIMFSTENKPGALNKILSTFEQYNINLSYIDSRPSRKQLGEYVFYVDFEGHLNDTNIKNAIENIKPNIKQLKILSKGANCF